MDPCAVLNIPTLSYSCSFFFTRHFDNYSTLKAVWKHGCKFFRHPIRGEAYLLSFWVGLWLLDTTSTMTVESGLWGFASSAVSWKTHILSAEKSYGNSEVVTWKRLNTGAFQPPATKTLDVKGSIKPSKQVHLPTKYHGVNSINKTWNKRVTEPSSTWNSWPIKS